MKAMLEFNLPDEEWGFRHTTNGIKYFGALATLAQHIRDRLKHGALTEPVQEELEVFRGIILEEAPEVYE